MLSCCGAEKLIGLGRRPGRPGGFTLVEVMVAVTIIALLLTTIYGVFTSVSGAKQRLETDGEGYHQARVLFDRIGRELRSAYFLLGNDKTLFSGGENSVGNPFLDLTSTAATPQGGVGSGLSVIRYELVDDEETEAETEADRKVLMRREYSPFDPDGEERPGYRLATSIEAMSLRFYDGTDWRDDWDARALRGLPLMVEVFLSIRVAEEAVPFRSVFEVTRIEQ